MVSCSREVATSCVPRLCTCIWPSTTQELILGWSKKESILEMSNTCENGRLEWGYLDSTCMLHSNSASSEVSMVGLAQLLHQHNRHTTHTVLKVYLTSPEPLKKCHNFLILHPILKTLPPLESTHLSRSTWNLTSKKLAVCPIRKVCHKESTWYLYKQFT